MKHSALIICSGGLDSSTMLYYAKSKYANVYAVTFSYGQNHAKMEGECVRRLCDANGIELTSIKLGFIGKEFSSSLLGGKIPTGEYDENNMGSTVVPFRNGIMLSVAAGIAESRGIGRILLGNHSGDHFIYPDCRPAFIARIGEAIEEGTGGKVSIESPFCGMTKADIVKLGNSLNVPFKETYSCYVGGEKHCGECGTCRERKEAFIKAGVADPTEYEK